MPILRSNSKLYPNLFPANYSGSQVLRSGVIDGPEQRLYPSGDKGLYGYKNLNAKLKVFISDNNNLNASLVGQKLQGTLDLPSSITTHQPKDLQAIVKIFNTSTFDIGAKIEQHLPIDLNAAIKIWNRNNYIDLNGDIRGFTFSDLLGDISTHSPSDFYGYIKSTINDTKDLGAYLYAELNRIELDLAASIDTHAPSNLYGYVKAFTGSVLDLGATLTPLLLSGSKDLSATIATHFPSDFYAYIKGFYGEANNLPAVLIGLKRKGKDNLQAAIDTHDPFNLHAYLKCFKDGTPLDFTGYLMGWDIKDLPGSISSVFENDLGSSLNPVLPVDLGGSIKTWPQKLLFGDIKGYQLYDLPASIYLIYNSDVEASISTHTPKNLRATLKGYGIEDISNIGGNLTPMHYRDLSGYLYVKQMRMLPGYLNPVPPFDLLGSLHGWQESYLNGSISSVDSPYDIKASIFPSGEYRDIMAYIKQVLSNNTTVDLNSYMYGWQQSDLTAYVSFINPVNLAAHLDVSGQISDLTGHILPKAIRLTTLIKVHTMRHSNLSATINLYCRNQGSGYKDLMFSLNTVYTNDLPGYLKAFKNLNTYDLNATIGAKKSFVSVDKLPLNVYINNVIKTEDKLRIDYHIFMQSFNLNSSIFGEYHSNNLSAYIGGLWKETIEFENPKSREVVYKLNRNSQVEYTRDVELLFKSRVYDYFFVSGNNKVYRTDRSQHWKTEVRSFIPQNETLQTKRKLNKFIILNKLTSFESVDEAVRMAIDYVTATPSFDLNSYLNPSGAFFDLNCVLNIRTKTSDAGNLRSIIFGERDPIAVSLNTGVEII